MNKTFIYSIPILFDADRKFGGNATAKVPNLVPISRIWGKFLIHANQAFLSTVRTSPMIHLNQFYSQLPPEASWIDPAGIVQVHSGVPPAVRKDRRGSNQ